MLNTSTISKIREDKSRVSEGRNSYQVYSEVSVFYEELGKALCKADDQISLMTFIYDAGKWSDKFNKILKAKVRAGVRVRIMVDIMGQFGDNLPHVALNYLMIKNLRKAGIEVIVFHDANDPYKMSHRQHIKLCAIDQSVVFTGGSNIGDYYVDWQDTNLKITGAIGSAGHDIFDYVAARSLSGGDKYKDAAKKSDGHNFFLGDAEVLLTVPGAREEIRNQMEEMILRTEKILYFRFWYFIPDKEFLNNMLARLADGVQMRVLLSDRTLMPFIDVTNNSLIKKLVEAGASVYRYNQRFMHSKILWNDQGEVILGSANLEGTGMRSNFELCVRFTDQEIKKKLVQRFHQDSKISRRQTGKNIKKFAFPIRILAKALFLASPYY